MSTHMHEEQMIYMTPYAWGPHYAITFKGEVCLNFSAWSKELIEESVLESIDIEWLAHSSFVLSCFQIHAHTPINSLS